MNCQMKYKFPLLVALGLAIAIVTLGYFYCPILFDDLRHKQLLGLCVVARSQKQEPVEETYGGKEDRWIGMPVETGSSNAPVFAINTIPGILGQPRTNGIVVVLWENGRVIWSRNDRWGGPPYYEGKIATNIVEVFVSELAAQQSVFQGSFSEYFQARYEPPWTVISVNSGAQALQVISAHEFIEQRNDRVCTMEGIRLLKKKESKSAVLAEQPLGYRQCRAAWETIRSSARGLTGDGKPVDVSFEVKQVRRSDRLRPKITTLPIMTR